MRQTGPISGGDSGKPRSAKRRILHIVGLLLGITYLLSLLGVFSPILSPLVYPNLAPPGWHNITPHGNIVLDDFAASAETPGLMVAVACGPAFNITVIDPTTWIPGRFHFWRSRDGGAHWELLRPPFGDVQQCRVSMPAGQPGTIIASSSASAYDASSTNATATWVKWISHDAGASWRRITLTNANYLLGGYSRHGILYSDSTSEGAALAYSTDDGVTWTPIPSTSSKLQQQGWRIDQTQPDYRGDSWWYRALSMHGQPPMLEHSVDDGRTWTLLGAIGTEPMQPVLLATTPFLPEHLCAARLSGETDHVSIFASVDGGQTWRREAMPANLANTTGETAYTLQIGANGDCYQGYLFHRAQEPENHYNYVFLHLSPQSSVLQEIPLGAKQHAFSGDTMYVPAGNGMQARLVVKSEMPPPGWASIFSGAARETDQGQILWAAVP